VPVVRLATLYRAGWTKLPLRRGLDGVLPEEILRRKSKFGFETPQEAWLRGPLRPRIEGWLRQDRPLWQLAEARDVARLAAEVWNSPTLDQERAQMLFRLLCSTAGWRRSTWRSSRRPATHVGPSLRDGQGVSERLAYVQPDRCFGVIPHAVEDGTNERLHLTASRRRRRAGGLAFAQPTDAFGLPLNEPLATARGRIEGSLRFREAGCLTMNILLCNHYAGSRVMAWSTALLPGAGVGQAGTPCHHRGRLALARPAAESDCKMG